MLDLNELEQLVVFADTGTLSLAAEHLHISQPTITRTMQHLEEAFGVPLFIRGRNKITLNDTGIKAVEQSRHLLASAENVLKNVRAYDQSLHTLTVDSCAPAPLWYVLPALSAAYPSMTIASSLKEPSTILEDLSSGACQLAILLQDVQSEHYLSIPFLKENLFVCVPFSHDLAANSAVTFSEINGFNFLLGSRIGFWDEMCRRQMPSSKFLVQTDEFAFSELIKESSLPYFTTNLVTDSKKLPTDRVRIPVTDPAANVTYYLVCSRANKMYAAAIEQITRQAAL